MAKVDLFADFLGRELGFGCDSDPFVNEMITNGDEEYKDGEREMDADAFAMRTFSRVIERTKMARQPSFYSGDCEDVGVEHEYHKLTGRDEKEPDVYNCKISKEMSYGFRIPIPPVDAEKLSVRVMINAKRVFVPYIEGTKEPERPVGSGIHGFYIKTPDMFAFRGVGGRDMAYLWHMLVIPSKKHCMHGDKITLRSVWDLTRSHLPLLRTMETESYEWLMKQTSFFYGVKDFTENVMCSPIRRLNKSRIQFGFHTRPGVGLLHLHVLVGPLTKIGWEARDKWLSLADVIDLLESTKMTDMKIGSTLIQHPSFTEIPMYARNHPSWAVERGRMLKRVSPHRRHRHRHRREKNDRIMNSKTKTNTNTKHKQIRQNEQI